MTRNLSKTDLERMAEWQTVSGYHVVAYLLIKKHYPELCDFEEMIHDMGNSLVEAHNWGYTECVSDRADEQ